MLDAFGDLLHWAPLGLPAFLFVITVVVFFHELGHFLVARACGVAVETFSIGFGRGIVGWTDKHGTRWKVSWIPLGGYVKFVGDADAATTPDREKLERHERRKSGPMCSRTSRCGSAPLVVAAGPAANFVLAIVIFAATYMIVGQQIVRPVVDAVVPNSAAAAAGIKPGDVITSVDGAPVESFAGPSGRRWRWVPAAPCR